MNRTARRLPSAVGAFAFVFGVARLGAAAPPETKESATSAVPASMAACESSRVAKWVNALRSWARALEQDEQRARAECRCDRPDTVCVDRDGAPLDDRWPERTTSGREITVCAVVPRFDAGTLSVVTTTGTTRFETVLSAREGNPGDWAAADETPCEWSSEDRQTVRSAAEPLVRFQSRGASGETAESYWNRASSAELFRDWGMFFSASLAARWAEFVAVRSQILVPDGDVLRVAIRRTEPGEREPRVERKYDIAIENGRYYLELALLVPFVYKGVRDIELVPTPGTGDLRVATREDWHVTAAAMIDVFPLGRQRAVGTSFRKCRSRSCVENWLGVQLGAGFHDFLQEWYFGLVFEPVSGLNLAFGTAVLKGEFMPSGRAEGMQLPPGSTILPNAEYMMRPYLGFSLTLDAIVALDRRSRIGQLF